VGTDELRIIGYYRLHPDLLDCPELSKTQLFLDFAQ
jgi:hypothetical protein